MTIHGNRRTEILLLLFLILILCFSAWQVRNSILGYSAALPVWISAGMFLLIGLITILVAPRIIRNLPRLTLDDEGFCDNSTFISVGRVSWMEVTNIHQYSVLGHRLLGVEIQDLELLLARLSPMKAIVVRINVRRGYPPISIPQAWIAIGLDELEANMVQRRGLPIDH